MAYTKSVLIIGGSGLIGTHLALRLREKYKVSATYHRRPFSIPGVSMLPFNVTERNWVKRVIYITQPDVIVYAAGYNTMEAGAIAQNLKQFEGRSIAPSHPPAQKDPSDNQDLRSIERIHTDGPAILVNYTEIIQPKFIYLSNPYLFDGLKGNYHETDTLNPANPLGKMKSGGENVVKSKCMNYMIIRSSPVLGRSNGVSLSLLDRMRMSLDRNQRFEASQQELHSFAPVDGLCELVSRVIDSGIKNRILHYGGLTRISFYDLAVSFAKRFGYDEKLVIPVNKTIATTGHFDGSPLDFSLNSSQTIELLKIKPFFMEESFDLIQKKLVTLF